MAGSLPLKQRLKRLLSPKAAIEAVTDIWHSYPLTFIYISLATMLGCVLIYHPNLLPHITMAGIYEGLAIGSMLSLAAYQWCGFFNTNRRVRLLIQCIIAVISVGNFIMVATRIIPLTNSHFVAYISILVGAAVAITFVPPVKKNNSTTIWAYTMRVLNALAMSVIIGIVMLIAISIIHTTLGLLFGVKSYKAYSVALLLSGAYLPSLIFLGTMPSSSINSVPDGFGRFIATFCKNVILPLVLVYMAILYAYMVKILIAWELPNGSIVWMVTGFVSVVLVTVYGLQGYICDETSKLTARRIATLALHFLPLLTLPLLVLMTVAIGYRINEYGLTASRLYVITFNIWAYAAIIYLTCSRVPHLNAVAASFAGIFLITSIIPGLNYTTIGTRAVQNKVMRALCEAGVEKFPITYAELTKAVAGMPRDEARQVADDLAYLDDWDNHTDVAPIVTSPEKCISSYALLQGRDEWTVEISDDASGLMPVPEGLGAVRFAEHYEWGSINTPNGFYKYSWGDSVSIALPLDSLVHHTADFRQTEIPVNGAYDSYMLCKLSVDVDTIGTENKYSSLNFKGYLLRYKQPDNQ